MSPRLQRALLKIPVTMVWVVPFWLLTGWLTFDWQWWAMTAAVVVYTTLCESIDEGIR